MAETVKLNLRLPPEVHATATAVAEALGVSLNTFILHAVANWTNYQTGRLRAGKPVAYPAMAGPGQPADSPRQAAPSRVVPKVGPNQPCPCGSGEKYKRCHGRPSAA
jgi:preprotein translocase subunit SecA